MVFRFMSTLKMVFHHNLNMYTPYSAFALAFVPQPYPIPNFNFGWVAGPDGRDYLDNSLIPYYSANPDQSLVIFKDSPEINKFVDPLFEATQVQVGFPGAGSTANGAYPYLYSYESQIGIFPGALEPNLSFQALRGICL